MRACGELCEGLRLRRAFYYLCTHCAECPPQAYGGLAHSSLLIGLKVFYPPWCQLPCGINHELPRAKTSIVRGARTTSIVPVDVHFTATDADASPIASAATEYNLKDDYPRSIGVCAKSVFMHWNQISRQRV